MKLPPLIHNKKNKHKRIHKNTKEYKSDERKQWAHNSKRAVTTQSTLSACPVAMCLDSTSANDSFSSTDCSDTASCASSEPDNEQSELRALCRRIQAKFNLNNRDKATTGPDTPASNNKSSDNNSNLMLTSNLSVKTLKYLSKLLALYKLDICKLLRLISVFFLYVVGDLK